MQVFSASVRVKARALKREKRKAESLITQMLPKTVAENLKQNKSTSEVTKLHILDNILILIERFSIKTQGLNEWC